MHQWLCVVAEATLEQCSVALSLLAVVLPVWLLQWKDGGWGLHFYMLPDGCADWVTCAHHYCVVHNTFGKGKLCNSSNSCTVCQRFRTWWRPLWSKRRTLAIIAPVRYVIAQYHYWLSCIPVTMAILCLPHLMCSGYHFMTSCPNSRLYIEIDNVNVRIWY